VKKTENNNSFDNNSINYYKINAVITIL